MQIFVKKLLKNLRMSKKSSTFARFLRVKRLKTCNNNYY